MESTYIFLPVTVQVSLTLLLYLYLAIAKSRAVKLGQVNEDRRALRDDAWPYDMIKINNSIPNQFELPVFYVLVSLAWLTESLNIYVQILAWLFVATRIFHVLVHVGPHYVPLRRRIFTSGWMFLVLLTLYLLAVVSGR